MAKRKTSRSKKPQLDDLPSEETAAFDEPTGPTPDARELRQPLFGVTDAPAASPGFFGSLISRLFDLKTVGIIGAVGFGAYQYGRYARTRELEQRLTALRQQAAAERTQAAQAQAQAQLPASTQPEQQQVIEVAPQPAPVQQQPSPAPDAVAGFWMDIPNPSGSGVLN